MAMNGPDPSTRDLPKLVVEESTASIPYNEGLRGFFVFVRRFPQGRGQFSNVALVQCLNLN